MKHLLLHTYSSLLFIRTRKLYQPCLVPILYPRNLNTKKKKKKGNEITAGVTHATTMARNKGLQRRAGNPYLSPT